MKTALIGAVQSTRVALDALVVAGHRPSALVTLPRDRSARHSDYVDLAPEADRSGVELIHASDVNAPVVLSRLRDLTLDYVFVVGWSQLCSPELLSTAKHGAVGFHPSALPTNRGRAVIPWTILQGTESTGSTLFWIDDGMDSGDVLAQQTFAVAQDETATSLYGKHQAALGAMLAEVIPRLASGDAPRTPQDHAGATWCARRTPRDGWIEWDRPARDVWTLIRASGDPYPGAFTVLGKNKLTIWNADLVGRVPYSGIPGQIQTLSGAGALVACGDGESVLLRLVQHGNGPIEAPTNMLKAHSRLGLNTWDVFQLMHSTTP